MPNLGISSYFTIPGQYSSNYTVYDIFGVSSSSLSRTYNITSQPNISLSGSSLISGLVGSSLNDPGINILNSISGATYIEYVSISAATIKNITISGFPTTFSTNINNKIGTLSYPGTYTLSYYATDILGTQSSSLLRTYNIGQFPTISIIGGNTISGNYGTSLNDQGIMISNNISGVYYTLYETLSGITNSTYTISSTTTTTSTTKSISGIIQNISIPGQYIVSYYATDMFNNQSNIINKTFNIKTTPTISLLGSPSLTLSTISATSYIDSGVYISNSVSDLNYTLIETISGNGFFNTISGIITNNVLPNLGISSYFTIPGQYSSNYTVYDIFGVSSSSLSRTYNITSQPNISLSGSSLISGLVGSSLNDPGINILNSISGATYIEYVSISAATIKNITISGFPTTFSTNINNKIGTLSYPGTYTLSYYATDILGTQSSSLLRTYNIGSMPQISLSGSSIITISAGSVLKDNGIIISNNLVGEKYYEMITLSGPSTFSTVYSGAYISGIQTISPIISANVFDVYNLFYTVSDMFGNVGNTVGRTINIGTIPQLSLSGSSILSISSGSISYDPGINITNSISGMTYSISETISGTSNIYTVSGIYMTSVGLSGLIPGSYKASYLVSDVYGNTNVSTLSRMINVTTIPQIKLNGGTVSGLINNYLNDPGLIIENNISGALYIEYLTISTPKINNIVVISGNITTISSSINSRLGILTTPGVYTISYYVTDFIGTMGNMVNRNFNIGSIPQISLSGNSVISISAGMILNDPGIKITNNVVGETYYENITLLGPSNYTLNGLYNSTGLKSISQLVSANVLDVYQEYYTVSDMFGINSNTLSRIINIGTMPIIGLSGGNIITISAEALLNDPGIVISNSVSGMSYNVYETIINNVSVVSVSGNINNIGNIVNNISNLTYIPDVYNVNYYATDKNGIQSSSTLSRVFNATLRPTITLNGDSTISGIIKTITTNQEQAITITNYRNNSVNYIYCTISGSLTGSYYNTVSYVVNTNSYTSELPKIKDYFYNIINGIIFPDTYSVIYYATDIFGTSSNKVIRTCKIGVIPNIVLNGKFNTYIEINNAFNDPGISIVNNGISGAIFYETLTITLSGSTSPLITLSGKANINTGIENINPIAIDTSVVDKLYLASYSVKDIFGNISSVPVINRNFLIVSHPVYVDYLTIDSNQYTMFTCSYNKNIEYNRIYPIPTYTTFPITWSYSPWIINNVSQNPIHYNIRNGVGYFGPSGATWTVSPNFLNLVNFNINKSWCFIIKVTLPTNFYLIDCEIIFNAFNSDFIFGSNTIADITDFTAAVEQNNGRQKRCNLQIYSERTSDRAIIRGLDTNVFYDLNTNLITTSSDINPNPKTEVYNNLFSDNSSYYFNFSYDETYITYEIVDNFGFKIMSLTHSTPFTFDSTTNIPWAIYNEKTPFTYNDGILFAKNYMDYSTYSKYFS